MARVIAGLGMTRVIAGLGPHGQGYCWTRATWPGYCWTRATWPGLLLD